MNRLRWLFRWASIPVIVACLLLIAVVPVLAFLYYAPVTITEESGTDYDILALSFNMSIGYLIANGYITTPTALDTRITTLDGTVQPHMVADDKVLMVVFNLAGNTTVNRYFSTGNEPLESFPIITGYGGYVTVPDNPDLELGDVYAVGVVGYVDTGDGSNKNIVRKDSAVLFSVTDEEELTFAITGGNSLVASNVTSGLMTIMIYSDGFEMWVEINDVEKDRVDTSSVPNNSNDWVLFENDVMPYVYYYSMWIVE